MIIHDARVEWDGYPSVIVQTDRGEMRVFWEQKLAERGVMFVTGPGSEGLPSILLPADPTIGAGELLLEGFTDDPQIVDLWRAARRSGWDQEQFAADRG